MTALRTFLVEAYAPASSEYVTLATEADRAARPTAEVEPIRHLHSFLVPEDETCFHVFEAESADSLAQAVAATDMRAQRIVEVLVAR